MKTDYLYKHTEGVEQDMGLRLITEETSREEIQETPDHWNGDTVGYSSSKVLEATLVATGFEWDHPRGGVISGAFAKPIVLAEATINQCGERGEVESYANDVALAIVTKLGPISEVDDILLGMANAVRKVG